MQTATIASTSTRDIVTACLLNGAGAGLLDLTLNPDARFVVVTAPTETMTPQPRIVTMHDDWGHAVSAAACASHGYVGEVIIDLGMDLDECCSPVLYGDRPGHVSIDSDNPVGLSSTCLV